MIELISIFEYNGNKVISDHNNRKREFQDLGDLDKYRMYLRKKLGKQIFFTYREKAK